MELIMKKKQVIVKPIKATIIIKGSYAKEILNEIKNQPSDQSGKRNQAALSLLNKLRVNN